MQIKMFLSAFAFMASAAYGASPSGFPRISLGCANANQCVINTDGKNSDGWFTLHAGGTVTANQFRAFVKSGGSQYQVGGSSITCYHITYNTATANARIQLASSTAADGITATSLTASGVKYESGGATTFPHMATASQTDQDANIAYVFDASSYPYVSTDTTQVWGIVLTCK